MVLLALHLIHSERKVILGILRFVRFVLAKDTETQAADSPSTKVTGSGGLLMEAFKVSSFRHVRIII
jgi:hypothetical protein